MHFAQANSYIAPVRDDMKLSDQLTLSIVSHGHGPLVEALVSQLDAIPSLEGVRLIVTLNLPGEPFSFESQSTRRLRLYVHRNDVALGFGANHNQAFARCNTPWFSILNPDLSLPTDIFTPLLAPAIADKVALMAPCVVNGKGVQEDSVRWNLTPWSLIKRRLGAAGESNVDDGRFRWFAGMFYLVNSAAYREIGGFDTRFFLYCEDFDLCARMHLARHSLRYQHNVQVIHDARRASWKSRRYLIMHLKSLFRVWCSPAVWRIALHDLFGGGHKASR